ncbi:MAG: hypothetical protein JXP34_06780, partial [Planctomycetes bacterium]|nr:hypothetical protein [Planctomycetota bacterium]
MKKHCFLLSLMLGLPVSADEIFVPNSNFEEIYKPGSDTITGTVSAGGWTQGVGEDCPIDNGQYIFSDGTSGTVADIVGWVGYDRDGWIALGGTYERDETTGNLQGSIANQGQGVDGSLYYLANGGAWANPAGGLIVSDAPLGNVEEDVTYTLSMLAKGRANPVVLQLLAGGTVLTPTSSVDPVLTSAYQEFSRTYEPDSLVAFLGQPLTICLGVGREATGEQSHFENVSLDATIVRCPASLSASGDADGVTLAWQNGSETPTSVRILRDTQEIASVAPADPPTYRDADAQPGQIDYELIFTMPGEECEPLATTFDACIADLAATRSEAGVVLTWTNNLIYDGIEIRRVDEIIEASLDGTAETYTDTGNPVNEGFVTYSVVPTNGTCDPATVAIDMNIVQNSGFEDPVYAAGEYGPATDWSAGYYDLADPLTWALGGDGEDAGAWNPAAADGFSGGAFAGQ